MTIRRIQGIHALVTGANRGIGKAFVESLLARGAERVYAAVRDPENVAGLGHQNDRLVPVVLDVTDPDSISRIKGTLPQLDLLINNAGIATATTYTGASAISHARMEMDTNYFGPLQLSIAMLDLLRQSRQAGIINISSIASASGTPQTAPPTDTAATSVPANPRTGDGTTSPAAEEGRLPRGARDADCRGRAREEAGREGTPRETATLEGASEPLGRESWS